MKPEDALRAKHQPDAVDRWHRTADSTEHDQPSERGEQCQAAAKHVAAEGFQHDVRTPPAREIARRCFEVLVTDCTCRSQRPDLDALLFSRGGRHDAEPEDASDLHGSRADATPGGVNEHGLAGSRVRDRCERVIGR